MIHLRSNTHGCELIKAFLITLQFKSSFLIFSGTLIQSRQPGDTFKSVDANETQQIVSESDSGNDEPNSTSKTKAGDLGSIVTLVGKVEVDKLSSKRMKHNVTDEHKMNIRNQLKTIIFRSNK